MSHDPSGQYPTQPPFTQPYPTVAGPQPLPPSPHTTAWLAFAIGAGVVVSLCIGGGIIRSLSDHTATPVVASSPEVTYPLAPASPDVSPSDTSPTPALADPLLDSPDPTDAPAEPAVAATTFGNGTWQVGADIKPGTYKAVVPEDSIYCVWERLKNLSGDLSGVIASDIATPGSHVVVTVKASDAAFQSTGCGTWTRTR